MRASRKKDSSRSGAYKERPTSGKTESSPISAEENFEVEERLSHFRGLY